LFEDPRDKLLEKAYQEMLRMNGSRRESYILYTTEQSGAFLIGVASIAIGTIVVIG
jgi:hypothetical protein